MEDLVRPWKKQQQKKLFYQQVMLLCGRRGGLMVSTFVSGLSSPGLTLYPLTRTADFPKSANKDTLPVYNIAFENH